MSRHALVEQRGPRPARRPADRAPRTQLRSPSRFLLWTVALVCVTWGGAYALGGPATAAHLVRMGQLMPIPLWGALLAAAGLAALVRPLRTLGLFVATCVVVAWAVFQGIALAQGVASAVAVPLTVGLAVLLGRCLYLDRTEARDARPTPRGRPAVRSERRV